MKPKILKTFVTGILILLIYVPSSAKPDSQSATRETFDPKMAEQKFVQAVRLYRRDFDNLERSRGLWPKSERTWEDSFHRGALPVDRLENYSDVIGSADIAEELRESFLPNTAVLFYSFESGKLLHVWLIGYSGIIAYQQVPVSLERLEIAINNLRVALGVDSTQISRSTIQPNRLLIQQAVRKPQPLQPAVAELSAILLPGEIGSSLKYVRHLIVVPILGIGTVPFGILQIASGDLINTMSISFAPSLFDLAMARNYPAWPKSFAKPLVIGNPTLKPDPPWIAPSLPGAEREAREIAKKLHTIPLTRSLATKTALLTRAGEADFLFFGTHGVASSEEPLTKSFLAFSAPVFREGWWTAREIQSTKLKANIAVLSACQTGLGRAHDAGTIGIARAFQIAGVPRVVMSLWSVSDNATADLMQSFVDHLADEIPAEALRQAMLNTKTRHSNPSKWASFVLFGLPK